MEDWTRVPNRAAGIPCGKLMVNVQVSPLQFGLALCSPSGIYKENPHTHTLLISKSHLEKCR